MFYATGAISLYWIINLVDQQVEVFSDPKDGVFQEKAILTTGQELQLPNFDWKYPIANRFA